MNISKNTLTPELFIELFRSVGWEPPGRAQVAKALDNTLVSFTVYDEEFPIGMVRLIGDGGMSFYIKDFAVKPAYQRKNIGSMLIKAVEDYIIENIDSDWRVSLELISTIEAVPFYLKKGFEERPCEWDGPGMFKMLP